ncbi:MAG: DNA helicase RecQ [Roseburia sp.]|nr:DNA helicase RecQ [Roseburia sp.]MCM1098519.1 DNA helicase RecQ [Ruminococcus flavefaciens]
MSPKETLKFYFGYESFRRGQEEIIQAILNGQDSLAVMPTGAGKSICYQIPALLFSGITIVISPLISLMQDQVRALNEAGIHAAYINSSLTETQIRRALKLAENGAYKIIYVAPERLLSQEFLCFAGQAEISMVTVDEAHCISQWGQDFRPSYLKIVEFIEGLPTRPIVSAFTATATKEVTDDILCALKLRNPKVTVTGFDRANLYYSVESIRGKDTYVIDYVEKHPEDSGIIYCATRKNVDELYEKLLARGVLAAKYHAGMESGARKESQENFLYDRLPVMVATNAFGMGIDKSDVRYVIHYNMPQSMENYYQEAGRAGRDGEPAQCILLFSPQDILINKFLLEKKDFSDLDEEEIEGVKQRDIRRLQIMEGYCRTAGCLRNYILNYFGERTGNPCGNCGGCQREYREVDRTEEAKWVVNCVAETRGRYGITVVIGTLQGANRARLRELGTVSYRSFGKLKDSGEDEIRSLIYQMVAEGYLYQTEDQYSVLRLGNIEPLKEEGRRVILRVHEEKEPERRSRSAHKRSTDVLTGAGYDLFEALRGLRREIAREEGLPPYIVFGDKTLIDMCVKLPGDERELLRVSGVGENKREKYGARFLEAIRLFLEAHPGAVVSMAGEEAGSRKDGAGNADGGRKGKSRKGRKGAFYLTENDADDFLYRDSLYASEIKEELNRICTVEGVKKAALGEMLAWLMAEGLVSEQNINGSFLKLPTEKGTEYGIIIVEKVSQSGVPYKLLKYPPKVQRMIVEYFVRKGIVQEQGI